MGILRAKILGVQPPHHQQRRLPSGLLAILDHHLVSSLHHPTDPTSMAVVVGSLRWVLGMVVRGGLLGPMVRGVHKALQATHPLHRPIMWGLGHPGGHQHQVVMVAGVVAPPNLIGSIHFLPYQICHHHHHLCGTTVRTLIQVHHSMGNAHLGRTIPEGMGHRPPGTTAWGIPAEHPWGSSGDLHHQTTGIGPHDGRQSGIHLGLCLLIMSHHHHCTASRTGREDLHHGGTMVSLARVNSHASSYPSSHKSSLLSHSGSRPSSSPLLTGAVRAHPAPTAPTVPIHPAAPAAGVVRVAAIVHLLPTPLWYRQGCRSAWGCRPWCLHLSEFSSCTGSHNLSARPAFSRLQVCLPVCQLICWLLFVPLCRSQDVEDSQCPTSH